MGFKQSFAILLAGHSLVALSPARAQSQVAQPVQSTPATRGVPAGGQVDGQPAAPQVAAPAQQLVAPVTQSLKILVLEGQHSVNDVTRRIGVQPVVEVRDENDRPVEGANVIFRLPPNGPGGTFDGHALSETVRTNGHGQAGASGFAPNAAPGTFDIHVTALLGSRMGQATITQTNAANRLVMVAPQVNKKPMWRNKYVLIAIGAAAAAGIALAVASGSGNKGVTITPGPVTINQ